ncbi:uncharacterized protein LOC144320837 [Canis aureus]
MVSSLCPQHSCCPDSFNKLLTFFLNPILGSLMLLPVDSYSAFLLSFPGTWLHPTTRHCAQTRDEELYLATLVKMGKEQGGEGRDVAMLRLRFIEDGSGSQGLLLGSHLYQQMLGNNAPCQLFKDFPLSSLPREKQKD